MKKTIQILFVLFLSSVTLQAQQEKGIIGFKSWLNNWTEFKPGKVEINEASQIITGNITTNTRLLKSNVYLLQGNVYVTNNATLYIEAGTVIIGDYDSKATLIITKGAKIQADGLETDPIVFTSNRSVRKAGDWGGIILLGDAPISKHGNASSVNLDSSSGMMSFGGNDVKNNSGLLRFVRIEFAGAKVRAGENLSSLLLAGVGSETIFDNVMVSLSGGNSFEVLGGNVKLNKLVSFKSSKDDFAFNLGAQCVFDNSLAIRASYLTNNLGSRCLNVKAFDKADEIDFTKNQTSVQANNLTLVNNSLDLKADIQSGLIKEGVYIGDKATVVMKKSVISGFNPAVLLDNKIAINTANLKKIKLEEMYFNLCKGNIFLDGNTNNDELESWYGTAAFFNVYYKGENKETFIDFANDKRPDYRLRIGNIASSGGY